MVPCRAACAVLSCLLVGGAWGGCGAVLGGVLVLLGFRVGRVLVLGVGHGGLAGAVGGRARCRVHSQHPGPLLCCVGVVLGSGSSAGAPLVGGLLVVVVGCL